MEVLLNRGDRQALDESLGELFPRFMEKRHSAVPITGNG
jgi:hypothetical protein